MAVVVRWLGPVLALGFLCLLLAAGSNSTAAGTQHLQAAHPSLYSAEALRTSTSIKKRVSSDTIMGQNEAQKLDDTPRGLESKEYTTDQRMLVHEGSMELSSRKGKLANLTDYIESKVRKENGYIEQRSFYTAGHDDASNLRGVRMTLRIPSDKFFETIEALRELVGDSMVAHLDTKSRDVTDEFVDAAARADVLDASRQAMVALMDKADTVTDVLKVQQEINRITADYESYKSRAIALQKQSSLSTLQLRMEEKEGYLRIPTREGVFAPVEMAYLAISQIAGVLALFGNFLVYVSIILIPLTFGKYVLGKIVGRTHAKKDSKNLQGV